MEAVRANVGFSRKATSDFPDQFSPNFFIPYINRFSLVFDVFFQTLCPEFVVVEVSLFTALTAVDLFCGVSVYKHVCFVHA